jgi:hypothetical protein
MRGAEQMPQQRCFPRLPWAGQHHGGKLFHGTLENGL